MKLTEFGSPIKPKLVCYRVPKYISYPTKVKEHPTWRGEPKPWAVYPHPSPKMHSSIECHYLYKLALELGPGDYANLGAFKGLSTACLAFGLKEGGHQGKIYSVDLFNHWKPQEPGFQLSEFNRGIQEVGLSDYVVACEGYTHECAHKLRNHRFKFILIDADHHDETCKQDFTLWSPLLAPGGLLAFHDCDMATVNLVIEEMSSQWTLVAHHHRLKVFRCA